MCFHVCSACTDSTRASRYDHALRFMMVGGIVSGAGQIKLHKEAAEMLQRCVHAFARGALPFRPVKSPLCSGLAGCCLCCARASAARSRLRRSCTLAPCAPPRRCASSRNSE